MMRLGHHGTPKTSLKPFTQTRYRFTPILSKNPFSKKRIAKYTTNFFVGRQMVAKLPQIRLDCQSVHASDLKSYETKSFFICETAIKTNKKKGFSNLILAKPLILLWCRRGDSNSHLRTETRP